MYEAANPVLSIKLHLGMLSWPVSLTTCILGTSPVWQLNLLWHQIYLSTLVQTMVCRRQLRCSEMTACVLYGVIANLLLALFVCIPNFCKAVHPEQNCAYFCSELCIVGYGAGSLWDLWIWTIPHIFPLCICPALSCCTWDRWTSIA